jgi:hypothetical protein
MKWRAYLCPSLGRALLGAAFTRSPPAPAPPPPLPFQEFTTIRPTVVGTTQFILTPIIELHVMIDVASAGTLYGEWRDKHRCTINVADDVASTGTQSGR